ncbi:MAG: hypothetical protein PV358_00770 [Acidimicrobiales bacterium]|nr:hypothetical protein [Acidimicrobiales bacterium]
MSKDTPAHVGRGDGPRTAANGASRPGSPVAQALRDLAPPRHGRTFWSDLDARLADEPQLRLSPRSAIRPITQPPPVIDDRNLAGNLKGDAPARPRTSRRTIVAVAVAVLVLLLGIAALQEPDDDVTTTDSTPETTAAPTPSSDGGAPEESAPEVTTPPGTIDPAAALTPAGVGPLVVGARMADLQAAGVAMQVDTSTFEGTGGTCYDAKVPGALDLLLRFRAPDGQRRAEDPVEGVLTSVSIESALPTSRGTDTGLALGTPQDQVLAAYGGILDDRPHPFLSGGHIYRADAGNGTGIAFFTDGQGVNRISVGEMDSIRFLNQCG